MTKRTKMIDIYIDFVQSEIMLVEYVWWCCWYFCMINRVQARALYKQRLIMHVVWGEQIVCLFR